MQLDELTRLPAQTRIQAMELLWQSMTEDAQTHAALIPAWHQQVLESRLARMQAGEEKVTTWEDAKTRLRDLTQTR